MAYHVGSLASIINQKCSSKNNFTTLFDKVKSPRNTEVKYNVIPAEKRKREVEGKLLTKRKKFKVEHHDSDSDEEPPQVNSKTKKQLNVVNAERRIKRLTVKEREPNPDEDNRTIFVGNLPCTIKVMKLRKLFKKYGEVESARLRCPPVKDPKIPKRVAAIRKEFHPERTSIVGYVRFVREEDARNALEANGMLFEDHHLRIDLASKSKTHDQKKAVFVGNLHFGAEENDLWKLFETCGPIESIRIVRDSMTGVGKGFCYVNFKDLSSVELALQLNGEMFKERPLRISRAVKKIPQKKNESGEKEGSKRKRSKGKKQFQEPKSLPNKVAADDDDDATSKSKKVKKRISLKQIIGKVKVKPKISSKEEPSFQGSKGEKTSTGNKKGKKLSKAELKKKVLAFQLQLKKINCT